MAAVPAAPAAPTVLAGDSEVTVSWTAPDDGGSAITDYDVQYRFAPAGSPVDITFVGVSTEVREGHLQNNTDHQFRVRAENAIGEGAWSPWSAIVRPAAGFGALPEIALLDSQLIVDGGQRVHLRATDTNPTPSTMYEWTADGGVVEDAESLAASWVAPGTMSVAQHIQITLTARNAAGSITKSLYATVRTGIYDGIPVLRGHWLLRFVDHDYAVWSGDGDFLYRDRNYHGAGQFMRLSAAEASVDQVGQRISVQLAAGNDQIRQMFLADRAVYVVEIEWIASVDGGITYYPTGLRFRGRTNNPVYREEVYTVELEPTLSDQHRQRPRRWSDEDQRERYPDDLGLSYVSDLVDGTKRGRWPP